MNKGNFLAKDDFPPSTYLLDFLQGQSHLSAKIAKLGGSNYILSGCEVEDGIASAGYVVIAGEPFPFKGGEVLAKITIQEEKISDHSFGVDYPEAYTIRTAVFSATGEYNWVDFVQVLTNQELKQKIESVRGEPPGMKIDWTGRIDRIPDNYMLADGRILKTADYPDLAWVYGKELEESFALPDLRHMFIAGYDSANSDYDSIGKTGGKSEVSLTVAQSPKHRHKYTDDTNAAGKFPSIEPGFPVLIGLSDDQQSSGSSTGRGTAYYTTMEGGTDGGKLGESEPHENRPEFYVLAYLIKVKY